MLPLAKLKKYIMENRVETMLDHWKLKFETASTKDARTVVVSDAKCFLSDAEYTEFLDFCIKKLSMEIDSLLKKV